MKLLRELFDINTLLTEAKKETITINQPKPRAKHVNSVLRSKRGGRMKSTTDYDRNAAKRDTRKAVHESKEGWQEYEELKTRIGNVLIKLYDRGDDKETISAARDRIARHLGVDPSSQMYQDAWMSVFNDAYLDGDLEAASDDDYTDYTMRQGEMGRKGGLGSRSMTESEQDCCYFWYDVSWEVKNRSGDGPETFDRHDHGVLKADTKEQATAMVKKWHPDAMNIRVVKTTKAEYDKEMND